MQEMMKKHQPRARSRLTVLSPEIRPIVPSERDDLASV